jgi:endonuclease/exonuclease/phosphatase family metal-dependent hydrolase
VVLHASDVSAIQGNWSIASDQTAADGVKVASADYGASVPDAALASPADYFEMTFSAPASTAYHVWLRMHASGNSKWNDSVWVQFSDAVDQNGRAAYRVGSGSGLAVNLASDASASTLSGWGWQDHAYWAAQSPIVTFINSGSHTIRVQTREDGAQIDQIVLSPATYLSSAPGELLGDTTILPRTSEAMVTAAAAMTPFGGTAPTLPGWIEAEDFDSGGEGAAYHDKTPGNNGGQYRSNDVDIEASSEGGYDIGWAGAGEWLNYTVKVASAGSYTVQLRVASPSGGSLHVGFNNASNVWSTVNVGATGGYQSWQTVSVPVTLGAGTQQMTIMFDTGGVNLNWINVTSGSSGGSSGASAGGSGGSGGALSPYWGSAASVPGQIEAEDFDNGGEGVAYHDNSAGNAGGQYRSTNVDIEASNDGGYDIGWAGAGEWLNYTVKVGSAGNYTVQLRVASPSGGALHVGFNNSSSVWTTVNVSPTGNWQSWKTVSVPVTLGSGTQQMTIMFDTGGVNLNWINVAAGGSGSSSSGGSGSSSSGGSSSFSGGSGGGGTVNVAEWNIRIDDGSESHARVVMDTLMAISPRPQVIVIEEAWAGMFNVYLDELQRQTGQTWHGAFGTHCAPGDWNGSYCRNSWYQGVGIFSTYDIIDSDSMLFPFADCWTSARVGVRAALNVNGTVLQVFGTHLQTGGCTDDAQARWNSMGMLKSWAAAYGGAQIAAGDFNADPDQIDTGAGMSPTFVDTWSIAGSGNGYTAFAGAPSMKIDYWFQDASGQASVQSTAVVNWTGDISDHLPVRATFSVR